MSLTFIHGLNPVLYFLSSALKCNHDPDTQMIQLVNKKFELFLRIR